MRFSTGFRSIGSLRHPVAIGVQGRGARGLFSPTGGRERTIAGAAGLSGCSPTQATDGVDLWGPEQLDPGFEVWVIALGIRPRSWSSGSIPIKDGWASWNRSAQDGGHRSGMQNRKPLRISLTLVREARAVDADGLPLLLLVRHCEELLLIHRTHGGAVCRKENKVARPMEITRRRACSYGVPFRRRRATIIVLPRLHRNPRSSVRAPC